MHITSFWWVTLLFIHGDVCVSLVTQMCSDDVRRLHSSWFIRLVPCWFLFLLHSCYQCWSSCWMSRMFLPLHSVSVRKWPPLCVTLQQSCIIWRRSINWMPAATTPCPRPTGQQRGTSCSCPHSPQQPKSEWSSLAFSVAYRPFATWLCCGRHTVMGSVNPTSGCW